MNKSAILDIFHGRKGHMETMHMPTSNNTCWQVASEMYDLLTQKLTAEQLALFEKFEDALHDCFGEELDYYFTEAFKLGHSIALECCE